MNLLKHLISRRLTAVITALLFIFIGFVTAYKTNNIYLTYGIMVVGIVAIIAMYLDRDAKIKLGNTIEFSTDKDNKDKDGKTK